MRHWTGLATLLACVLGAYQAQATVYELPENGSAVFGTDERIKSRYQDTLLDIARRYSLGYEEIIRANPGVDMWLPGEGTDILLPGRRILPPGPREGIVVNLPEHRLYYFPKAKKGEKPVVITYPVSIGKMDWSTPLGETRVISKQKHPAWYPPESVRKEHIANGDPLPAVVPAGPDNPLGDFAMRLAVGGGSYMLHGTNNPMAVGMAITHGCIRMYPEDVAALFPLVPVGTKVWLINDPVKVAYVDGELLLEAHPPVDKEGQTTEPSLELLSQLLDRAVGNDTAAIHWDLARETLQAANGIPAVVGLQADLGQPPAPSGAQPSANAPQHGAAQTANAPNSPDAPLNGAVQSGTADRGTRSTPPALTVAAATARAPKPAGPTSASSTPTSSAASSAATGAPASSASASAPMGATNADAGDTGSPAPASAGTNVAAAADGAASDSPTTQPPLTKVLPPVAPTTTPAATAPPHATAVPKPVTTAAGPDAEPRNPQ